MPNITDWTAAYPQWAARGLIPLRKPGESFTDRTGEVKVSKGKEPLPNNWQTVHALRDAQQESWQQTMQDMRAFVNDGRNIGLVIPVECVVLDLDTPDKVDEALRLFPDAPVQRTQSGGAHFWFRVFPGETFTATTKVLIHGLLFDIRSGGRSQVVVSPSTGLQGSYVWLRPLPPDLNMLPLRPDALLAHQSTGGHKDVQKTNYGYMPAKPDKPKAADYAHLQQIAPDLYEKIKTSSALGVPGDRNNAMARAVGFILATCSKVDRPPHPEIPFSLLYRCVEEDRSIGSDGGLPPTIEELWDLCCRMADRERPDWLTRQNILTGLQMVRQAGRAQQEEQHKDLRQATAEACNVAVEDLSKQVLLIDVGGNYWVLDTELQGYHGPLKAQAVLKYLHEKGSTIIPVEMFYNGQNKMRPVPELLRDCGQQVQRIWYDSRVNAPVFDPREGALIRPAWKSRPLEPERNEGIEGWLSRLAGDMYETLCDWLATVPFVQYPTSCLYLHGPTGTGKTLFVEGLAKLWSAPPVPFRHAVADFNSGILGSPLVFVEEGLASDTDSMRFRDLLTTEVHDVRVKYEAPGELRGHVRMVVAANNPNALRIKEDLTHSDREAISRRILWLDASTESGYYLTAIGGRRATEAWVAEAGFARHILWLAENRGQQVLARMDRLLVPGNSSSQKTRMLLTHRIPRTVLRIICMELQADAYQRTAAKSTLGYSDGTVEVHWGAIRTIWAARQHSYGNLPTDDTGERALESLAQGSAVKIAEGQPRKYFRIDRGVLLEELRAMSDYATTKLIEKHLVEACRKGSGSLN